MGAPAFKPIEFFKNRAIHEEVDEAQSTDIYGGRHNMGYEFDQRRRFERG